MLQQTTNRVMGGAAAALDFAIQHTALARSGGQRRAEDLRHEERIAVLGRLEDRYEAMGAFDHFFRPPRAIEVREERRLERQDGFSVIDVHWPSDYETFLPEVNPKYTRTVENRTATARLVVHADRRPLAILVHGYLGGVHRMERRIWPMRFLERMGMDVALFVLPFHGPRAAPRRLGKMPPFPGADPRITNEGFRQAISDFRDFVRWAFERGHPQIGVMGMSLGGFTTALAATLEPKLSFAVPIIPLTSFPDVFRRQGRLGKTPREIREQYQAVDAVYRVTSPLHRQAAIDRDRILVVAGEMDQITPVAHARKLAEHFQCRIETWPGGHIMQFGRADKFRSVGRFLNEIGVVSREASDRV